MEMEVKLRLQPADRDAVEGHPALRKGERGPTRHQSTTYFDTPDLALRREGASVRVRQSEAGIVQTVKLSRRDAPLGTRFEWEWDTASPEIDREKLKELPEAASGLRPHLSRLAPVFLSDVRRDLWTVRLDGGKTEIEAVIDAGTTRAGNETTPVSEVELELKAGRPGAVYKLALDLAEAAGLRYEARSKAERGYALLGAGAVEERPGVALDGATTLVDAFSRLVASALREFAAEIPAASSGEVEGVHRLRAAIRKLRTLLVLFAPYLDRRAARRFNGSLRALGAVLGHGRDWDVFLTETLPAARDHVDPSALDALAATAAEPKREAHARIEAVLDGLDPTRLILGMAAWTAEPDWLRDADPDRPFAEELPRLLDRLDRKIRKRAKAARHGDGTSLHELRKAMKKLRYSVEDVASLFEPKAVRHHLRELKGVLRLLGEINDAAVTQALIEALATDGEAAKALANWNAVRRRKALQTLEPELYGFLHRAPFWRHGDHGATAEG